MRESARRPAPRGPGRSDAFGELEVLLGEPARAGDVVERDERLGVVDAPGGDAGVPDAELVPALGGGEQVGVRVGGAVLGEPQAGAALEQQRRGERAGRRVAEQVRGGERGVGVVELVELGQRVDEREQRPDQRGRRAVGELEVEREPGVGLRVADAAGAHERRSRA